MKILIKLQLQNIIYSMFNKNAAAKKKRVASKVGGGAGIFILVVYVIGCFVMLFGTMFSEVAKVLIPAGYDATYFSIALIMSVLLGIFGSVFITEKTLFGAADNDFLLSLPFKPVKILVSRLISLVVIDFLYSSLVFIPAVVVYALKKPVSVTFILIAVIEAIVLPFIEMAITVILAWGSSAFTRRSKHKNTITTIVSIVLMGAYLLFYFNINSILSYISANPESVTEKIKRFAPQMYFGADALGSFNFLSLAIFLVITAVASGAVLYALSASFIKIATSSKNTATYKYQRKSLKASGVFSAMFKKEIGKIFGTPIYFINACFGAFMLVILAVVIAVKGGDIIAALMASRGEGPFPADVLSSFLPIILTAVPVMLTMMTTTSPISISIEGTTFDILKSMPLGFKDIVYPKIFANVVICYVPAFLFGIVCIIRCGLSFADGVGIIILPLISSLYTSIFGMNVNLKRPKFDWTNETVLVKQSAAVMISVFANMGIIAVIVGIGAGAVAVLSTVLGSVADSAPYIVPVEAAFLVLITLISYLSLSTRGKKRFMKL